MTEENKVTDTGVESSANGQTGGKQVENGKEAKVDIQELIKQNEQLMNELKSRDKALNDKSQMLKDYESKQEADRLARLSESEQLKELKDQVEADKQERELINAATANGLNPTTAKLIADKVRTGDYSSFGVEMAKLLNEVKETTSQKVETEVKSKIQTSTAPATKETQSNPFVVSMRRAAGLN